MPNWLPLSGQEDSPPMLPFHLAILVVFLKPFLRIYSYGLWALALFIPCQAHVSAVRDKEGVAALILLQTERAVPAAPLSRSNIVISMTPSGIARHRAGSANSFA